MGQYDPQFHSLNGFIGASLPSSPRASDGMIIETTGQLLEFPYRLDMNSGQHLGIGRTAYLLILRSRLNIYLQDGLRASSLTVHVRLPHRTSLQRF